MVTTTFISPARIVRQALVDLGVVIMPMVPGRLEPVIQLPGDNTTPCYVPGMPDEIDQLVCIRDTIGRTFGRNHKTGRYEEHAGIRIFFRAIDPSGISMAMNVLRNGVDQIYRRTVTVDGIDHFLQSVYHVTQLIDMGEEPNKKRQIWSIDCRVAFQDQEP